jgi:hypothetical protein
MHIWNQFARAGCLWVALVNTILLRHRVFEAYTY